MTSLSLIDATKCLEQGRSIHLDKKNNLCVNHFGKNIRYFFKNSERNAEAIKVIEFIKNYFTHDSTKQNELLNLGNALIKKYKNVKELSSHVVSLDHILGIKRRKLGQKSFLLEKNDELLKKWISYGFNKTFFEEHPEFAEFLLNSTLASQMKITRDEMQQINGQPAILVEGQWTSFETLKERFEYHYVREFNEVLIHEKATGKVFTYLDRGQGLVNFHPFKEGLNKPISCLSSDDYQTTLHLAQEFVRTEDKHVEERNRQRTCIFQLVSNRLDVNTTHPITGNFNKLFLKRKHPYVRIINSRGEVFEIGYGIGKTLSKPLETSIGKFRSIDAWEFIRVAERRVTNIAISEKEFEKAQAYVNRYLNNKTPTSFNFMQQNCTVFASNLLEASAGIKVPTKMSIFRVAIAISPEFIKNFGRFISRVALSIARPIARIMPNCLKTILSSIGSTIKKLIKIISAFIFSLINVTLGGMNGAKGLKFSQHPFRKHLGPPLLKFRNWFDIKVYNINNLHPLQKWQKAQKTTIIYKNPLKLSIAA